MNDQTELNALTSDDHGNLDNILARAHAIPIDKASFFRPEAAMSELTQAYGIKSTSRLAYLPQPAVSQVFDWPDSSPFESAEPDVSLAYLCIDRDVLLRESRQSQDEIRGAIWKLFCRNIPALSFVDAAAVVSSDHLTEMAKLAVWVVEKNVQFTKSGMTISVFERRERHISKAPYPPYPAKLRELRFHPANDVLRGASEAKVTSGISPRSMYAA
jgi:hypothetical protein